MSGQPASSAEAVFIIKAYMYDIGKPNDRLVQELTTTLSPIYPAMVKHAFEVSVQYFEKKTNLCKLLDTDGKLLFIW